MQAGVTTCPKQIIGEETPASLVGHIQEATAINQHEGSAAVQAAPVMEQQRSTVAQPLSEQPEVTAGAYCLGTFYHRYLNIVAL